MPADLDVARDEFAIAFFGDAEGERAARARSTVGEMAFAKSVQRTRSGSCDTNSYRFTLYALSVERLDLDENASDTVVSYMAGTHVLAKAEVIGLFE